MCWRAWRHRGGNLHYFTLTRHGVPTEVIVIGRGREAWNVCDYLAQYIGGRKVPPMEIRPIP
jgi:hypothetical protein